MADSDYRLTDVHTDTNDNLLKMQGHFSCSYKLLVFCQYRLTTFNYYIIMQYKNYNIPPTHQAVFYNHYYPKVCNH